MAIHVFCSSIIDFTFSFLVVPRKMLPFPFIEKVFSHISTIFSPDLTHNTTSLQISCHYPSVPILWDGRNNSFEYLQSAYNKNAKLNNIKGNPPITKMQFAEIHLQLHKCILHFSVHKITCFVSCGNTRLKVCRDSN